MTLDGRPIALQRAVVGPHLALLLYGDGGAWDAARIGQIGDRFSGLVKFHLLSLRALPGALVCGSEVLERLGVRRPGRDAAQLLVRPDGYVAFRCGGRDLAPVTRYLARWFPRPGARPESTATPSPSVEPPVQGLGSDA